MFVGLLTFVFVPLLWGCWFGLVVLLLVSVLGCVGLLFGVLRRLVVLVKFDCCYIPLAAVNHLNVLCVVCVVFL